MKFKYKIFSYIDFCDYKCLTIFGIVMYEKIGDISMFCPFGVKI